jgi:hypothetical protein
MLIRGYQVKSHMIIILPGWMNFHKLIFAFITFIGRRLDLAGRIIYSMGSRRCCSLQLLMLSRMASGPSYRHLKILLVGIFMWHF